LTQHRGILNTHRTAGLRYYAASHDWLTIVQLPSYSPDLNPAEGIWSPVMARPDGQHGIHRPCHLTRTLRRSLAHIQRHPELIDGCLAETGLTLTLPRLACVRSDLSRARTELQFE
jgi:putative transposase